MKGDGKLWAGISVTQPVFREGETVAGIFQINFVLVNDGNKVVNPEFGASKLLINGKEVANWGFIVSNGPKDNRWEALPPKDYILFGYALGEYFEKPGIYRVVWKGKAFQSPELVFRVMAKEDGPRGAKAPEKAPVKVEFRLAEEEAAEGLTEAVAPSSNRKIYLHKTAVATNADLASARVTEDSQQNPAIAITFTKDGAKKMQEVTEKHVGKPLAILVNGKVVSAPTIRSAVSGEAQIVGLFTTEEVEKIVDSINGK